MNAFEIGHFQEEDFVGTAVRLCESWTSTGLSSVNDPNLLEYHDCLAVEGKD